MIKLFYLIATIFWSSLFLISAGYEMKLFFIDGNPSGYIYMVGAIISGLFAVNSCLDLEDLKDYNRRQEIVDKLVERLKNRENLEGEK